MSHNTKKGEYSRLTRHAGKQLSGKVLNLTIGERHESVSFQKVEDTLAKQIHDNADVPSIIEAIPEVDASIPVFIVIGLECRQNTEFYA